MVWPSPLGGLILRSGSVFEATLRINKLIRGKFVFEVSNWYYVRNGEPQPNQVRKKILGKKCIIPSANAEHSTTLHRVNGHFGE